MSKSLIRSADLTSLADAHAVLALLDAYAADPMGTGKGLAESTKSRLIDALRQVPEHLVLLAFVGVDPLNLDIAMRSFSRVMAPMCTLSPPSRMPRSSLI